MKTIRLLCPLRVTPFNPMPGPGEEPDEHAKELRFEDTDTGEVLIYQMAGDMAKTIGGKLKMNNRALAAQVEKERMDAIARATIAGPPNGEILGPGGAPLT